MPNAENQKVFRYVLAIKIIRKEARMIKLKIQDKKGQMHLPLEMVFSILLIAVFLFVVFFVVRHFLDVQKCAQVGLFARDLQDKVDGVWNSQEANTAFEEELPAGISNVCFADLKAGKNLVALNDTGRQEAADIYDNLAVYFKYSQANFFFYPWQNACNMAANNIKHVNLANLSNPLCFSKVNGGINIKLSKGFNDALVRIGK